MSDVDPPKLLVTTSLILDAIYGTDLDSAGRSLLKMSEHGLANIWVGRDTIRQIDLLFQRTARSAEQHKDASATVAEHLVRFAVDTAPEPDEKSIERCRAFASYESDAKVLATAMEQDCEVIVATDHPHLLRNPNVGPPNTRFVVMGTKMAFDWAIDQAAVRSRLRALDDKR
jgi:hypothetical protein